MPKTPDHICLTCANYNKGKCPFYVAATQNAPDQPITDCSAFEALPETAPAAPADSAAKEA